MRALLAVSGALAVLLSGCAIKGQPPLVVECSQPSSGERPGPALVGEAYGLQATPIPLDSVQFSDWATTRQVAIQSLSASRTPTDTVRVTARFVSCTDTPTILRIRASFMDAGQAPTEPATAWKVVSVQPRTTAVYSESSVSTEVSHYLIEITGGN